MGTDYKATVIVDFDGTITMEDAWGGLVAPWADKEWERLESEFRAGKLALRDCSAAVGKIVNLDESKISDYANNVHIREGFCDFVNFCKSERLNLIVASSGFDIYIKPVLKRVGYGGVVLCNDSFLNDDGSLTIEFPHDDGKCQYCTVCKGKLARSLREREDSGHKIIGVGDGLTDLCMIGNMDLMFARAGLLKKVRSLSGDENSGLGNKPENKQRYFPFESFFEVIDKIKEHNIL